jgi:hypothetical protein
VFDIKFGAGAVGAASGYVSGSTKLMRLRLPNTVQYSIFRIILLYEYMLLVYINHRQLLQYEIDGVEP